MTGLVHSIQSLGTLDGPGVRFVTFLSGCVLRCKCCHNPDTWEKAGTPYTSEALLEKALRYRPYFGETGGVTLSGGEPLLQAEFATEYFTLCKKNGIHTCLDTSGCILNDDVRALLAVTDRVLLDIKYTNEKDYRENVGCSLACVLDFLAELQMPTTLRQVIIPTLNDTEENVRALAAMATPCVDSIELLPFRKLCMNKYDAMGIPFPLADIPEPTAEQMAHLKEFL